MLLKKTALITGASVGIGRAIAHALAADNYQLILLARRIHKLTELANELTVPCHQVACDITDQTAVDEALDSLPGEFQKIDVLVNNAGLALGLAPADQSDWNDWQTMIETNCLALAYMTRKILPTMRAANAGYVVNVGSTAGSYAYQGGNVYGASKAFVEHFTMGLRSDLLGSNVRVCHISPGLVKGTEFSNVRFHGDTQAVNRLYEGCEPLVPTDVAESVRWVLAQPEHVNINHLEIMPTCQAPAGLAVAKN